MIVAALFTRLSPRHLLLLASLLLPATLGTLTAQSVFHDTIEVEGAAREFIVAVPSSYTGATPLPVVIMFHGTGGDGERFYNISGWKEKGEAEGIITVFPSALRYRLHDDGDTINTTKWMTKKIQDSLLPGQTPRSDILFMNTMLDSIERRFAVDTTRIYASGFSNGGQFAAKVMVDMSDRIAAVHVAAGTLVEENPAPRRLMPVLLSVGEKDDRFTTLMGLDSMPLDTSILSIPIFRGLVNSFRVVQQIDTPYTAVELPMIFALHFTELLVPGNRELVVMVINNAAHIYPNGTNHPVVMANIAWEFFKRYSLPQTASVDVPPMPALVPSASNHITLPRPDGVQGELALALYSMGGELVRSSSVEGGDGVIDLSTSDLVPGAYLLNVAGRGVNRVYRVLVP